MENFKMLTYKLSQLLNVFRIVVNSRQFFRELLVEYQDVIHKVMKLLGAQNVYISYLGGQIIYALLHVKILNLLPFIVL